jgi:hypothetical protein
MKENSEENLFCPVKDGRGFSFYPPLQSNGDQGRRTVFSPGPGGPGYQVRQIVGGAKRGESTG